MDLTLPALAAAIGVAVVAAAISARHIRHAHKKKLALARIDLIGFILAYGGVIALLPESIRLYAPELVTSLPMSGTLWERLDYIAFFFVSAAFGVGVTRRYLTMRFEDA